MLDHSILFVLIKFLKFISRVNNKAARTFIFQQSDRGPLYDYVHRDDGKYSWEVFDEIPQDGFTTYYINVTTQQWYDGESSSLLITA